MGSECATSAIWDNQAQVRQTAVYNIISTLLVVVLIVLGIALMAGDFHALVAGPVGKIMQLHLGFEASLSSPPCTGSACTCGRMRGCS